MSAAPRARWRVLFDRWVRRVFPAYLVFLAFATHLPKLALNLGVRNPDKWLHFVAFGLLAVLFWWFVESYARPLGPRFAWIAAVVLTTYAALDEWTQRLFNRGVDFVDWLTNVAGISVALVTLEARRRLKARAAQSQFNANAPHGQPEP